MHVDSLTATFNDLKYKQGSVPIQLVADSSSTITILKAKSGEPITENMEADLPCLTNFEDIPQYSGIIGKYS